MNFLRRNALSIITGIIIGTILSLIAIKSQASRPREKYIPEIVEYEVEWIPVEEVEEQSRFTQEEIDLLARVVMSEASVLSIEAKQMVAETVLNRVDDQDYPDTIKGVVYQKNQFSTTDNGEPTLDCYLAVDTAITYRAFPRDLLWFCSNDAHHYGNYYCKIGNTTFRTREDYNQ